MQLIGLVRLGRDAELRYTPDQKAVCNLALAYNYGFKDQSGNKPSQWVDASLWGKQAEAMDQYLTKGKLLCVTINDVHIEEYESKGEKRTKLIGIISNIEFAGGNSDKPTQQAPAQQRQSAPSQGKTRNGVASRPAPDFTDMDDDIPF